VGICIWNDYEKVVCLGRRRAFLIYLAHGLIGRTWVRRAVQAGLAFLMQELSQTGPAARLTG